MITDFKPSPKRKRKPSKWYETKFKIKLIKCDAFEEEQYSTNKQEVIEFVSIRFQICFLIFKYTTNFEQSKAILIY